MCDQQCVRSFSWCAACADVEELLLQPVAAEGNKKLEEVQRKVETLLASVEECIKKPSGTSMVHASSVVVTKIINNSSSPLRV